MFGCSLSSNEQQSFPFDFNSNRFLIKRIHLSTNNDKLNFTINEEENFLRTIRIDSVVRSSEAHRQGMKIGDRIISVNGISFLQNIHYDQALRVR